MTNYLYQLELKSYKMHTAQYTSIKQNFQINCFALLRNLSSQTLVRSIIDKINKQIQEQTDIKQRKGTSSVSE